MVGSRLSVQKVHTKFADTEYRQNREFSHFLDIFHGYVEKNVNLVTF